MEVRAAGRAALQLEYEVEGDIPALRVPTISEPERRDNLWQTTCFELFVTFDDGGYAEFNFSPSTCWADYRFDSYRKGMRSAEVMKPTISASMTDQRLVVSVQLDLSPLVPDLERAFGLSAVIEQTDGTKSWWALAHPAERPDFHHRDCFTLQLGAAKQI